MDAELIEDRLSLGAKFRVAFVPADVGKVGTIYLRKVKLDSAGTFPPTALSEMPGYVEQQRIASTRPYAVDVSEQADSDDLLVRMNTISNRPHYFATLDEALALIGDQGVELSDLQEWIQLNI